MCPRRYGSDVSLVIELLFAPKKIPIKCCYDMRMSKCEASVVHKRWLYCCIRVLTNHPLHLACRLMKPIPFSKLIILEEHLNLLVHLVSNIVAKHARNDG
jgi:hypothetical protein